MKDDIQNEGFGTNVITNNSEDTLMQSLTILHCKEHNKKLGMILLPL